MPLPNGPADSVLGGAAKLCRNVLHRAFDEHERANHNGERCGDERANVVGFLIHSLGLSADEVEQAILIAMHYHQEHPNSQPPAVG